MIFQENSLHFNTFRMKGSEEYTDIFHNKIGAAVSSTLSYSLGMVRCEEHLIGTNTTVTELLFLIRIPSKQYQV